MVILLLCFVILYSIFEVYLFQIFPKNVVTTVAFIFNIELSSMVGLCHEKSQILFGTKFVKTFIAVRLKKKKLIKTNIKTFSTAD